MTKFMIIQNYSGPANVKPITEWTAEDVEAHIAFQVALNDELTKTGELVDALALAAPEMAKFVTADGSSAPVVTDGPYPEGKELLAGYRTVDVESEERALEIAARVSAAPGPDGVPIGQTIEVREVMGRPGVDDL